MPSAHSLTKTGQRWRIRHLWLLVFGLDLSVAVLVAYRVRYTEIDWRAYMQQVHQVYVGGERDYARVRGQTGPLVYPGGFLRAYRWLQQCSRGGEHIAVAQRIFAALHALHATLHYATLAVALHDQTPTAFPLSWKLCWCTVLGMASRRVMSIYVLRLFNDAVESVTMQLALLLLVYNRRSQRASPATPSPVARRRTAPRASLIVDALAALVFSLAVSIKMNALLYAPAVLLLVAAAHGLRRALILLIVVCGAVQLVLGWPFLSRHPISYLRRAFELSRVFEHRWSVNYAFLPVRLFTSRALAMALLSAHVAVLALAAYWLLGRARASQRRRLLHTASGALLTLGWCHHVGILFARTLHYQFLAWNWWLLPFLCLSGAPARLRPRHRWRQLARIVLLRVTPLGIIEVVFQIYPPRPLASAALHLAHLWVLALATESALHPPPLTETGDTRRVAARK